MSVAAVPFLSGSTTPFEAGRYLPALPVLAAAAALVLYVLSRAFLSKLSPRPASISAAPFVRTLEGLLGALALVALSLLVPMAAGSFRAPAPGWMAFAYPSNAPGAAKTAGVFLVQSLFEELLFRGLVMGAAGAALLALVSRVTVHPLPGELADSPRLRAARRKTWLVAGLLANALQAWLFTLVHGGNPGVTPLATANIGLAGFVLGWLFWSQGSLWGAWAFHFTWNFGLAAAGLPVSGVLTTPPLLRLGLDGVREDLFSGGHFGPEASLTCTAGLLVFLAVLLVRSRQPAPDPGDNP